MNQKFEPPKNFDEYCRILHKKAKIKVVKKVRSSQLKLPMYQYIHVAQTLMKNIKEATNDERNFNIENIYVLKLRYILLYNNVLKVHKDGGEKVFENKIEEVKSNCLRYFEELEEMKNTELLKLYENKYKTV